MKILFLTHYYPPEGNAPATRINALAKRWAAAGHEVTVITGVPNVPNGVVYEGYTNKIRSQEEEIHGVRVIRVWTHIAANKGSIKRIINFVSYMANSTLKVMRLSKPDVLIASSG